MDPSQVKIPPMKDLTVDNITENVIRINSLCEDQRMKYVLERLVSHLHDFARETRLSSQEWMAGLMFLTEVGKICSDVRQEFILLSDVLGLSILVDSIDHPKPPGSTEGTVLGPFHTHEAEVMTHGDSMSHDPKGEPLLVVCTLKDTHGNPISGVKIDIWETDSTGHYDVQYAERDGPDGRCIMRSDDTGVFWFKAITPVPYPIPHDGPVGKLLKKLHRHPYRPSHMHFMFEKEGYDHLITALYLRNDPYETSDAVFGVKDSLVVDLGKAGPEYAKKYGVSEDHALLTYDFVLVSDTETSALREQNSKVALDKLGRKVKIVNGLPVPDLD
ncbi:Intradiol ring-cleavage dioxygenase [Aspergillus pseudonomiae]|uniref:Intradiol ring-cleavage dioxygenase n=2 Tax=Aspergillus subgen. Circumdati TaxID=2720871 RepID=A0A5N7D8Q5_9EURO|nr:putative catechol dioxygenase [Aspergillus nomiae NRRL 13137]XP_031939467.1 Intradiol ring-cleavage dioxygenase [Aspergillus pseudonomiae]KAB8261262.1 Intradiol ring-cleavage dioxygenase [Aspergillus pseudonomiae]KAE8402148.1 Intradiol ring-cleavage dioxygenase [Aspergillus pseudonomiae]KNG88673.1 putative catechol dioxygenase [Aspergillus nomiae NRRL 13137]